MTLRLKGVHQGQTLAGTHRVASDKSISHRAVILSALSRGQSRLENLLESEDCLATLKIFQKMGVSFCRKGKVWEVDGAGRLGLLAPSTVLDCGNSGTSARLLAGVLAAQPFESILCGDESLSRRPMRRVAEPLERMGAQITTRQGRLPMVIRPAPLGLRGIEHTLEVPSAQVKSALLLAGLWADSPTVIHQPVLTREHTEVMFELFGMRLRREDHDHRLVLEGRQDPIGADLSVPADPSSAIFLAAAALLCPQSRISLPEVLVSGSRCGAFEILQRMGARIEFRNPRTMAAHPIADIDVSFSLPLRAVETPPSLAPAAIDEFPILAVVACFCEGVTVFQGLGELRHKESNRLDMMVRQLQNCGVGAREEGDSMVVVGRGADFLEGGQTIETAGDHRIAMAFAVLAQRAKKPLWIKGAEAIETSFPAFLSSMVAAGAVLQEEGAAASNPSPIKESFP